MKFLNLHTLKIVEAIERAEDGHLVSTLTRFFFSAKDDHPSQVVHDHRP